MNMTEQLFYIFGIFFFSIWTIIGAMTLLDWVVTITHRLFDPWEKPDGE